jgi:imidazole glycerol-phosphate synthase subunit HisH
VCEHGFGFTAVMERGNLLGVQFHPEKSGAAGAQLLANFVEMAR